MGARTSNSGSFASLAPRLLARKGAARPAMRSASGVDLDELASAQSELGWDDAGPATSGSVIALPCNRPRLVAERGHARKVAFTLRLDAERHLRLRLASTLKECSAQALLTEALDRFLEDISQLEAIAATCGAKSGKA